MANMAGGGKKSASEISVRDPQISKVNTNTNRNKTGGGGSGKKSGK